MGKNINPGIVLSVANMKGGVGKSTLTMLLASYFHSEGKKLDLKVCVIDADDKQQSLYRMRQREQDNLVEGENEYKILQIPSADIPNKISFLQSNYDLILVDLPGNIMQPGIISSYYLLDIIIIPSAASELDIDSTIQFYNLLSEEIIEGRKSKGFTTTVSAVFNRVNPQVLEFKNLYNQKNNMFPFPFFDSYVKDSKVDFQRNITTDSSNEYFKGSAISFCKETLELIYKHVEERG